MPEIPVPNGSEKWVSLRRQRFRKKIEGHGLGTSYRQVHHVAGAGYRSQCIERGAPSSKTLS